jgi:ribosomal-protein-alanine N-acetyltransferase
MDYTRAMSLRPAVQDDLPQVMEIERESYPEPWTEKHFQQELTTPYARFLVLTDDETDSIVMGYLVYWVQAEGVSLLNIAVAQKWRRLGLGRIILATLINEAVREEIPRVILEVRESNTAAIHFYENIGFARTHTRPAFYSNGETAIVMEIKTSDITTPLQ